MNPMTGMVDGQSTTKSKFRWEDTSVLKSCPKKKKQKTLMQLAEKKAAQAINAKITVVITVDMM